MMNRHIRLSVLNPLTIEYPYQTDCPLPQDERPGRAAQVEEGI